MNTLITNFFSNLSDLTIGGFSASNVRYPFSESPWEFFQYSEDELAEDKPGKLANALAHAERALASQIDYFFKCYGLSDFANANKWGNGKKIALLGDLGVIRSRILHKVNQARNSLEHRYEMPSPETAANALDVVGIFLSATDMFLYPAREAVEFYSLKSSEGQSPLKLKVSGELENTLTLFLDRTEASLRIKGNVLRVSIDERVNITSSTDDYFYLLTLLLNYHRLDMKNPERYFRKLRYFNSNLAAA